MKLDVASEPLVDATKEVDALAEDSGAPFDAYPEASVSPDVSECIPAAARPCYTGPSDTRTVGTCRDGAQTCGDDGRWGACTGATTPSPESCDGRDEDCDGTPDNHLAPTACPFPNAAGVCRDGVCARGACNTGFGDCDGDAANGCERDVTRSGVHCGACGASCLAGQRCVAGRCEGVAHMDYAVGQSHVCAVLRGGRVACWGDNARGAIGDLSRDAHFIPDYVPGVEDAVDLELGDGFSCALRAEGEVVCWGRNDLGQLGDGSTTDRVRPAAVAGVTDVVELVTGAAHVCARRRDGAVRCWGDNHRGQLGDGSTTLAASPTPGARGLADIDDLVAGEAHTCARTIAGEVWCWGANDAGQLGVGDTDDRRTPTRAGPTSVLTNLTGIAAGARHTCALRSSGEVFCWGANDRGQVGDGSTAASRASRITSTRAGVMRRPTSGASPCASAPAVVRAGM